MLLIPNAYAAEISQSLRTTDEAQENFLELGLGVATYDGPQVRGDERDDTWLVMVNGRYQWRGLFVENFAEDTNGLVLGYNVHDSDDWSLDLMVTSKHRGIDDDNDELRGIERKPDVVAGARLSGYAGDYLWQLQGWHDISQRHEGFGVSASVGRSWQLKNWTLHALTGASYHSKHVLDYYYGVSPEESAASGLQTYQAHDGVQYSAEVGLTRPLSSHWVFRTTARYDRLPGAVASSPLLDSDRRDAVGVLTSFTYVF